MNTEETLELIFSIAIAVIGIALSLIAGGDIGWIVFGFILFISSLAFFIKSKSNITLVTAFVFWAVSAIFLAIGIGGLTDNNTFGVIAGVIVFVIVLLMYLYEK